MKQILKHLFLQKLFLPTLFLIAALPSMMHAKYHVIKNDTDFDKLINQYEFSLVCFAPSQGSKEIKEDFKDLQNRVKAAANRDDFKTILRKDVGFLVVDNASKKAQDLPGDYAISKFPTCMLFAQGAATGSKLVAPKSASELMKLLEQKFGTELEKLTKQRREDERLNRQERIANYYAYASSPYAWYPYAYWPYSRWGVYPYGVGWGFDVC